MNKLTNLHFSFLSWLLVPLLLVYVSISYMLSNLLDPRWEVKLVNAASMSSSYQDKTIPSAPPPINKINWNNEGLVTFWFDDAWLSQYEVAFPILQKYGYRASLAVPTKLVNYDLYMNWYQIRRLQYLGWEINAHSRTHTCQNNLDSNMIQSEVLGSADDLKSEGLRQTIYVLPCGLNNSEVNNLVRNNYQAMRTVEFGLNPLPLTDNYNLKIIEVHKNSKIEDIQNQIDLAKLNRSWIILTFHQISTEDSNYAITPNFFNQVVDLVRESNLQVVLPSEVPTI